ncbi:MAG: hypothetical protein JW841_11095 [Deltaproteobacteria bacterium]|nr:hypothetical protein [Deltaproteobacteria bacterium]
MSHDIDLGKFSEKELIQLNHRIVERLNQLQQTRRYHELAKFNVGDTVSFTPECGHVVIGTVVRLNQKTATIVAKDGMSWRVSPTLLSKVQEGNVLKENQGVLVSLIDYIKSQQV